MSDFVLELLMEEIPAGMQAAALKALEASLTGSLKAAGLVGQDTWSAVTPRRLAVAITGLDDRTPDVHEERKGPKVGAPQAAIDGFLRAAGVSLAQCVERQTPKGPVWMARIERPGRPTAEILADAVSEALAKLPWPKSMRWEDKSFRWVRPLHQVLAVFGGVKLHGAARAGDRRFPFTDTTFGHRFLAPEPLHTTGPRDYRDKLAAASVVLSAADRRDRIRVAAEALCTAEGLTLKQDDGLAEEVAGLVEWPVVHLGRIDPDFMDLPDEVLATSMRQHQRYFSTLAADGTLAPCFVVVANTRTRDGGAAVIAGNQRVLRARLADARFFWDQDRKVGLEARLADLAAVRFHEKLGDMHRKAGRMNSLARLVADHLAGADSELAGRAARLAKADLVTGMVGEFPELQGVMGRYYARAAGEADALAEAIGEHYRPLGPKDRVPTAPLSVAVALADKLDTLAGFFAIDERPTGSRDPYALRRAALGVIRIILETGLRLPLRPALTTAVELHGTGAEADAVVETLMRFLGDRLKVALRGDGLRHDLIDAAFAREGEDDLVRIVARVRALAGLLGTRDGENLLAGYRRAANIARIEARKDGVDGFDGRFDRELLAAAEERALAAALAAAGSRLEPALAAEEFAAATAALADLRAPIDAFFDQVTVNDADATLRRNRLSLLAAITATMDRVADFSRIEG